MVSQALTEVNAFDTYDDEEEDDRKQRYLITNPEVFMRHHTLFKNNYVFKNPHHSHKRQGVAVSPILEDNLDFKSSIIQFAQDNLQVLTSELLNFKVISR